MPWEYQRKIGEFSVLAGHIDDNRNEQEGLKDAKREMELILDEDEPLMKKCGDGFVSIAYDKVTLELDQQISELENEIRKRKEILDHDENRADQLKDQLIAKFGDSIQLEK